MLYYSRGDFMSLINKGASIFVNIFVHYPEVYNSSVISRNLEKYFNGYFINNKLDKIEFNGKVYVTIKSAPHNEEQMIKVDFDFIKEIDESIKLDWRNYLFVFLDKQINDIRFN